MQTFRVAVTTAVSPDTYGRSLTQAAHELDFTGLTACHAHRLYFLHGHLTSAAAQKLAQTLLADPVTENYTITQLPILRRAQDKITQLPNLPFVETVYHPGVTDPPAENLLRAARELGIVGLEQAATGWHFALEGDLPDTAVHQLAANLFANPVIQSYTVNQPVAPPFAPPQTAVDHIETIPLGQANEAGLRQISRERRLALNLAEMQAIQAYFQAEGRDPTDVELEMLAQTWSEHCVHKTFKATIRYTGPDGETQVIDGLLNSYIRAATERINKPWVHSAFVDNAGIVAFDERYDLAFKVETHNHPSALEPFGGANTGIGGVVRDVLGVSAKPIANTDVLCFGPPDLPPEKLPHNVLHPRRVAAGVIHGIEDYGNKMGIPTVNGAIVHHEGYTANPLVYCGCLGLLPRGSHPTEPQAGDLIIALGGHTGRDGLRGATFSSMEMDTTTSEIAGTAVQIGHPIMEKQVQEVILRARDEKLYHAITDCGAGGFSSAVGEMGEKLGARVQLSNVPLKYPGLRPWEIWLSEAQERMVLAVPPENWPRLQAICTGQDVEAFELGVFTGDGRIRIYAGEQLAGDLSVDFLHNGLPPRVMEAVFGGQFSVSSEQFSVFSEQFSVSSEQETDFQFPNLPISSSQDALLALLAHPDIRSKEDVIRRYDHEVQGGTAVKPLTGAANHGPSDAAVLLPMTGHRPPITDHRPPAVALSNGICPQYSAHDPYIMAWAAIDEAVRNAVAVGADPDRIAILDNFCWGNPELPDRLGGLVRCAQGCYDAAVAYGTPFISGKDSLNNEYTGADGRKHAIPGTLLISALGLLPDVSRAVTMDFKQPGSRIYVLGDTRGELLASHYVAVAGNRLSVSGDQQPQPAPDALARFRALHQAIGAGVARACHDCSEGGLAVTLAEMCLAGNLGAVIDLAQVPADGELADAELLFSQSLSRFVIEVAAADTAVFEQIMAAANVPCQSIGQTTSGNLQIQGQTGELLIDLSPERLTAVWRGERLSVTGHRLSVSSEKSPISNLQSPNLQSPKHILILHANGTNRDKDAALACQLAGGEPEIVHVNQLAAGERRLLDYHMLVVPGGFSYGDDLGAGVLWALDLSRRLAAEMERFVADGRPVLGICNGFQALVKAGFLPGGAAAERPVTLTYNESGHFECRWVWLAVDEASPCLFTQGLTEPIYCPVAHGEGRLAVRDTAVLNQLQEQRLIPLTYANPPGMMDTAVTYPANPNGSLLHAAALCNPAGNVLGLMPHPENHIFPWQHPRWQRGERGMTGLRLFENGVRNA